MWRKVMTAYLFAACMVIVALVPGLNVLYAAHGGPAWLLFPFVFPVAVVRLITLYATTAPSEMKRLTQVILGSLVIYAVASLGAAYILSWSVQRSSGLRVTPLQFWTLFFFPLTAWPGGPES